MKTSTLSYGTIWPDGHVYADEERFLINIFSTLLNSNLEICRYTDERYLYPDLLSGKLHFASTSGAIRDSVIASCMYVPLVYHSLEHFIDVWDCQRGRYFNNACGEIEQNSKAKVLAATIVGDRDFVFLKNSNIIKNGLGGLKIRVDGSPLSRLFFEFVGAIPVPIAYYCTKHALDSKTVCGAENAPFNMLKLGWLGNKSQFYQSSYRFLLNFELANADFWETLSQRDKRQVADIFRAFSLNFLEKSKQSKAAALESLSHNAKTLSLSHLRSDFIDFLAKNNPPLRRAFTGIDF